jgi:hypothetical protein
MTQQWGGSFHALVNFLSRLLSTVVGGLREFVWSDLRSGFIDLRRLSRPVRAIIWLGFGLTILSLLLLTQTPALRALFPLYTSVTPVPGRGLHIPIMLFPLSLFLLSLAWTYVLTGARRCHWPIRWGVLLLYTLNVASWLATLLVSDPWAVAVGAFLFANVLICFFWPDPGEQRVAFIFAINLIAVGGFYAVVQTPLVLQDQASGLPIGKTVLEGNLRSLATLAIPLLILIGLDIADFTVHASTWLSQAATALFARPFLVLLTTLLIAWLAWQCIDWLRAQQALQGWSSLVWMLTGSFGLVLILWIIWGILARISKPVAVGLDQLTSGASAIAAALVIAFLLPLLTTFLYLEIAQVLESVAVQLQTGFYGNYPRFVAWATSFYAGASAFSSTMLTYLDHWQRFCALLAIVLALYLARKKHHASALYAVTAGINYLWVDATRPGHWLQRLGWSSSETVVLAWVVVVIIFVAIWLWKRQLSAHRLRHLLLITLILTLLRQTDLIASPLNPLFNLAGVGALAVGLSWDLLTAGSWANEHSAWLPQTSRIFLYLGYVLLTVMLVNWAVAAHDFTLLDRFTGEAALTGLALLGYPYLFVVIYLTLTDNSAATS